MILKFMKFLLTTLFFLMVESSGILDKFKNMESTKTTSALEILKERGIYFGNFVNRVRHVCQSHDGKSNFIDGDVVCRQALSKMGLSEYKLCKRAYCSKVTFTKYNKMKNGKFESKDETAFMAKCVYKNKKGKDGSFFVFNGPEKHFYYVFEMDANNKKATVRACLKIEVKTEDFPKVTIMDTKDPSEADNIFGVFGRISDKKKDSHICEEKNEGNFAKICSAVMKSDFFIDAPLPSPQNPARCNDENIARNIIHPTTFEVTTRQSRGLTCFFQDKNKKSFRCMIFDGPNKEYYYLAKYQEINGRNQMTIQACIKVPGQS